MKLTLGHSPDPDDAFMFYALAAGKIDTGGYEFDHILQDIQTLNERAHRVELDITAVSIHAFAYLMDNYALLSSGASMGDGYGPMIVARGPLTKEDLRRVTIAVPGELTSAFLALQLYLGGKAGEAFRHEVVAFDEIPAAVKSGRVEAGLLIHEGQLTYAREGLVLVDDLGAWWGAETGGLPLPLGGNAIRRSLGADRIAALSKLLRESIAYGLEHRADAVRHALPLGRGLSEAEADRFVGMYVNGLTLDYGERGRAGVREFLKRGAAAGLIPDVGEIEFV
jgi:1,4-dihydroxy-6-naphthoate synthase